MKNALVVRGGWDGHQPREATERFIPHLQHHGYTVRVEESTEVYGDAEYMATVDLVMQANTMNTIDPAHLAGLVAAVRNGTGMGGWHGGIADSYRNSADYLHMIGGQFAHHAGIEPEKRDHPIVAGLEDFELTTEQYWVLSDSYNDVLATTTVAARPFDAWQDPVVSPSVWTRQWGKGRIFVCTAGHRVEVLDHPSVRTIIERGLLWASR